MICSRKGYPLKVVMPDNVTPERTQLLQMYGAEIVYSPGDQGSNGAVAMALEMAAADASYYMPYQYGNQANPNAHYYGTAPEIIEELDEVAAFVAGLGTGGTLMGNGRRLREEYGDAVKIVAAEPMQGEPVQGLRSLDDGFIPPIIDLSLLDRKIFVTNHDAIVWTRQAARRGGHLRRRVVRRDRLDRRADRERARRGQRRLHRLRRRLEVPLLGHLHPPGGRDREPGLHRLVVRLSRRGFLGAAMLGGAWLAGCGSRGEPVGARRPADEVRTRIVRAELAAGAPVVGSPLGRGHRPPGRAPRRPARRGSAPRRRAPLIWRRRWRASRRRCSRTSKRFRSCPTPTSASR